MFLCGLERFDGGEARESGVGSGVYDVVVPILWTLSCPSTEETVHGPTALSVSACHRER